ncbi:unnamed protein product, partial [marine sediment metagenome]
CPSSGKISSNVTAGVSYEYIFESLEVAVGGGVKDLPCVK